jgi:hypothetical protein
MKLVEGWQNREWFERLYEMYHTFEEKFRGAFTTEGIVCTRFWYHDGKDDAHSVVRDGLYSALYRDER